jgi:hypothetical protein
VFARKQPNQSTSKTNNTQTGKRSCVYTLDAGNRANSFACKHENAATSLRSNPQTRMTSPMSKRAPLSFKIDKVTPVPADATQTSLPANTTTRKRAKDETKPGRDGRKFIAAHVTPDAAKQFKLLSVQQDMDVQELLTEAINDLFAKYGLSRIA